MCFDIGAKDGVHAGQVALASGLEPLRHIAVQPLLPSAMPVIHWRALSLTMFILLLTSMFWEVTPVLPNGWWGFQDGAMIGLRLGANCRLKRFLRGLA